MEDAEALLRSAVTGDDPALESLLAKARIAFATGDFDAGLEHLRAAALARPGYADTCALLGSHELRAGRLDDAIATLVQALELNPDFHAARLELARGLEARGEREAALREVSLVLEVEPAHVDAGALRDRLSGRRRAAPGGRS